MSAPTCQQLRTRFLEYFAKKGHQIVPSSPVIPHDDPTLLFNNAGMNQFKDVFLGTSKREYSKATTSQKCIRAGGKHNDLENVGHTARHMTFFEMLGNFSFGDYFKEEAIAFAWELSTEIFQFSPEKIFPTVFRDDDEAFAIWEQYVPAEKITRFDEKENFWAMGETGPCGPCSELYYDRGELFGDQPLSANPDSPRYLEYWNLVFMQYERDQDGTLSNLPKQSVDTGSGLERVASLLQGTETVFETDLLLHIISAIEKRFDKKYDPKNNPAPFRVIADHLRTLSFAIADGAQPSNTTRGYVLRKILRRAVRYARTLHSIEKPFLADLLPSLIEVMGGDYPELVKSQERIEELLTTEEESFQRVLKRGKHLLSQVMERSADSEQISGDDAFVLKDTYGFPLDEIQLLAKDAGLTVNEQRFAELEKQAKDRSRSASSQNQHVQDTSVFQQMPTTTFVGYEKLLTETTALHFVQQEQTRSSIQEGQEGLFITESTPFYAEKGGQVGDQGTITNGENTFVVTNTKTPFPGVIIHVGTCTKGAFSTGDTVIAKVDETQRKNTENNHTATHILHWALQKVLGDHIQQAGSFVDSERIRFDFNHHKALTTKQLEEIEDLVNQKIRSDTQVKTYELSMEQAQKRDDIKQFFGDKYGQTVRVVDLDYSKELCGGTHTKATGKIGYCRITKESSIAAGIRRIEAVTGSIAEEYAREKEHTIAQLANALKVPAAKLKERLAHIIEENQKFKKTIDQLQSAGRGALLEKLLENAEEKEGLQILSTVAEVSAKQLRALADEAMEKLQNGVVILGIVDADRCQIVVKCSKAAIEKGIQAKELIAQMAPFIQGKGGGKPDQAQAGGSNPEGLVNALQEGKEGIISQLVK